MRRGSGRRCSQINPQDHGRPQDDQSQIQLAAVIITFELWCAVAAAEADYAPRHSENQLLAGITATSCYPLTCRTQMDSARSDFTSQWYRVG